MKRAIILAFLLLGLLPAPATIFAKKSYSASDFSSDLDIQIPLSFGRFINEPAKLPVEQIETQIQQAEPPDQGLFWLLGSGMLLLVGVTPAFFVRRPPARKYADDALLGYEPPDNLPPAISGTLFEPSGSPKWHHALATFFDFANRGYIRIDESSPGSLFQSKAFDIRLIEWPIGLRPHEQALFELFFMNAIGRRLESIRLSRLEGIVNTWRWKVFEESLKTELKSSGLWSKERESARKMRSIIAIVFLVLAFLYFLTILIIYPQTGIWSISPLIALILNSIAWILAGTGITIWSETGWSLAVKWKPFYTYIRQVAGGKIAPKRMNEFHRFLPYTAAFGQLRPWVKSFQLYGWGESPDYFHTIDRTGQDSMGLFVMLVTRAALIGIETHAGASDY